MSRNETSPPAPKPILEVTGLTLRFGGVTAIDDVSFEVRPGELFAVIGPNGAGKSSIFNCVSGVYPPAAGSITLEGEELVGLRPSAVAARGVARTFQNFGLFDEQDIVENLLLGRDHLMRTGFLAAALWFGRAGREEAAHRARVMEIIDLLDLGRHCGRPVGLLPYGVRKRVELARALAMEPKLLLLDEPVAGMNFEETRQLAADVLQIKSRLGVSVVMVEHDMPLVMAIADRVMVLDFGQMLLTGTPDEVQRDPRVIEAYLGRSQESGEPVARDGEAAV